VKGGEILLASHDIYTPYDKSLEHDVELDYDLQGREKSESSIFDVTSLELNSMLPQKIIKSNFVDTQDLHIDFENGMRFDTFIAHSRKYEFYRFIDFTDTESKHIVVFDVE
jgi:hypothetical protein